MQEVYAPAQAMVAHAALQPHWPTLAVTFRPVAKKLLDVVGALAEVTPCPMQTFSGAANQP